MKSDNAIENYGVSLCRVNFVKDDVKFWTGFKPKLTVTNHFAYPAPLIIPAIFVQSSNKEEVTMMLAYQCDNKAFDEYSITPVTGAKSDDGCKSGVGDLVNKFCRDLLFVWTPGSEGEKLPDGKGIKANPVQ